MDNMSETERALRAEILGAVARGWCSPKNAAKVMDADLAEAITAELLPLFHAAVEQAHSQDEKFTYCAYCGHREAVDVDGSVIAQHIRTCEKHPAREWERQAVAGAYAAAAKVAEQTEYPFLVSDEIRKLTPADARQAQPVGFTMAWQPNAGTISSGMVRELSEKRFTQPEMSAAIASAEARAREKALVEVWNRWNIEASTAKSILTWLEKELNIAGYETQAEAAARTPDSTPKITMTHGGLPGTVSPSASGLIARCESPDSTKEPGLHRLDVNGQCADCGADESQEIEKPCPAAKEPE